MQPALRHLASKPPSVTTCAEAFTGGVAPNTDSGGTQTATRGSSWAPRSSPTRTLIRTGRTTRASTPAVPHRCPHRSTPPCAHPGLHLQRTGNDGRTTAFGSCRRRRTARRSAAQSPRARRRPGQHDRIRTADHPRARRRHVVRECSRRAHVTPVAKYVTPVAVGIAAVLMVGYWWRHPGGQHPARRRSWRGHHRTRPPQRQPRGAADGTAPQPHRRHKRSCPPCAVVRHTRNGSAP